MWNGKNEKHLFLNDLISQFIRFIFVHAPVFVYDIIDGNWISKLTTYFWCCILVGMLFACKEMEKKLKLLFLIEFFLQYALKIMYKLICKIEIK